MSIFDNGAEVIARSLPLTAVEPNGRAKSLRASANAVLDDLQTHRHAVPRVHLFATAISYSNV